jgi:hypothetical protein
MELTAENVTRTFRDCLFKEGEDTSDALKLAGIVNFFGLHPARVASHTDDIVSMLEELPDQFRQSKGGGWTFLNACNDRHGNQWTGLHSVMEQLFVLGLAIKRVEACMPRDLWDALPGGVPYYVLKGL